MVVIALSLGSVNLPLEDLKTAMFSPESLSMSSKIILFDLRLPRVLLAVMVGSSLSLAGSGLQGILRNPLADPYIIGTSAGASLGATIAIVAHIPDLCLFISSVYVMAFLGAILAMLAVYKLAKIGNKLPIENFLLSGVIVGSFVGALVSFLLVFAREDTHRVVLWMVGSLNTANWRALFLSLPYFFIGMTILGSCTSDLNILGMGEEKAQSLGVNVERVKIWVILACALMTASCVATTGMIGFVGLIVPHITRLIVGPDHKILLPMAAINGAIFLVCSDTIARVILSPQELPVGILTAMLGAPFFFWISRGRD